MCNMCKYAERCGDRGPVTIPGHVFMSLMVIVFGCVQKLPSKISLFFAPARTDFFVLAR